MLGHNDVAKDFEVVTLTGKFQRVEKDVFRRRASKIGLAALTTEGDEMVVAFSLESFEARRHG
jgi:hypothetical protein